MNYFSIKIGIFLQIMDRYISYHFNISSYY